MSPSHSKQLDTLQKGRTMSWHHTPSLLLFTALVGALSFHAAEASAQVPGADAQKLIVPAYFRPVAPALMTSSAQNDAGYLEFEMTHLLEHGGAADEYRRVWLDTDADQLAATGFALGGVGAEFLVENGWLYRHEGGGWSWAWMGSAGATRTVTASSLSHPWSVTCSDRRIRAGKRWPPLRLRANASLPRPGRGRSYAAQRVH